MNHYSQNDEQEFILNFFSGKLGNLMGLLEIGAFDGVTFSNTRALLELGWHGVLVEPDPRNVAKLIENSASLDVHILAAAVGGLKSDWAQLSMDTTPDRGWSSTISNRCLQGVLQRLPTKLSVPVVPASRLFQNQTFDFISIDAEGMDFEILKAIPTYELEMCSLLCVEPHNVKEREEMRTWFKVAGFETAHETPENLLVVRA